jgi:hypothetical protein
METPSTTLPADICAICGAQKYEVNHWHVAIVVPGLEGVLYQPYEAITEPRSPSYTYQALCGEGCSLKHHSQYLGKLKAKFTAIDAEGKAEVASHAE